MHLIAHFFCTYRETIINNYLGYEFRKINIFCDFGKNTRSKFGEIELDP